MKWGTFTAAHMMTLVLAAAMLMMLYRCLKAKSRGFQTRVLFPLSCSGIAAIVYNLMRWGAPLEYLPLHLCSINAMLLPIVVLTRNKTLGNLLLVWCLGALVALVANFEMAETELFGEAFIFYYFPHVFEFGIPVLLFKLGLVEKDPRCIGSTLAITMGIYTVVHVINRAIRALFGISVNYMFSVEPTNPLTALFYKVIPYEYWYMYMVLPIVAVYLLMVYAPQLTGKNRKRALRQHGV